MPPEICDIHDLRMDEYGCWACGHSGPITADVWPSWYQWSTGRMGYALKIYKRLRDGIDQANRGETIDRGDFSQYLQEPKESD